MYIFPFGDQYSKVEKEIIFVVSYNAAHKFCIWLDLFCKHFIPNSCWLLLHTIIAICLWLHCRSRRSLMQEISIIFHTQSSLKNARPKMLLDKPCRDEIKVNNIQVHIWKPESSTSSRAMYAFSLPKYYCSHHHKTMPKSHKMIASALEAILRVLLLWSLK